VLLECWKIANNCHVNTSSLHFTYGSITNYDSHITSCPGQRHQNAPVIAESSVHNQVQWQSPSHGRVKCNVDAAFSDQRNITGVGICIRDDEGTFVLAKVIPISSLCSISMGEALALYHALEWLSDMSFDHVDFCSNSKVTVDVTETGYILTACRRLFTTHFTNSKVEFSRQQTNEVAHTLAGVVTLSVRPKIYYHVPRCIEHFINSEML